MKIGKSKKYNLILLSYINKFRIKFIIYYYTPEFHMPPQEDYDPNWDPYYKWMPENKYHDRWVEENQHNHGFDNSDYVDGHYYYDDDG